MNLIQVVVVQDESSHWYVIPIELESEFYRLMDIYDLVESAPMSFDLLFQQYRTNGSPNNFKLYAQTDNNGNLIKN